eukprot:NODE_489_length_1528_cov_434.379498.p1 GENE.NODE_489_length_1528_cov_434.379498~~NODE_489_length_1528_cov_434.379498.p1  ORF type:complete len:456 (+),score=153.48 NODE_489_length_1528_cov_434.379498:169-1368(+)
MAAVEAIGLADRARITAVAWRLAETFDDMCLKEELLRGIYAYGFERPSCFQKDAIPAFVQGRDVLARAQSGTGKTASYVVGSLQRLNAGEAGTQALVLVPTRELACPIQHVALALGEYMRATSHACVGGVAVRDDILSLQQRPHFVVGTPGRVGDMILRRHLSLADLKMFVLDEADEMMSRGFKGLIYETVELLPPSVQLAVFSATMPPDVVEYMKRFLREPLCVQVKKKEGELTLEGVRQFYIGIEKEEWKLDTLCDVLEVLEPPTKVHVYCNTRRKVEFVAGRLAERGLANVILTADLTCDERDVIVQNFGTASSGLLLSTDLRGNLSAAKARLVINYDLPANVENYLSRVGQSAASGQRSCAINMVTNFDVRTMKDIERHYHAQIEEMPMDFADLI